MKATKEQIIAEADRRRAEHGEGAPPVEHFIVDVVCEGWTPPEPVDPDVLIAREAAAQQWERHYGDKIEAQRRRDGWCDTGQAVTACRIAARMAREQERERAKVLVDRLSDVVERVTDDGKQDSVTGVNASEMISARVALAKYRGEA